MVDCLGLIFSPWPLNPYLWAEPIDLLCAFLKSNQHFPVAQQTPYLSFYSVVLTSTFLLHNDFPILFWKYILLFSLSFYCSCFKRRNCKLVLNIVLLDKMILSSLFPVIPLPFLELWKSMYCIPNAKSHTVVFLVKHISSFVDHEQHHIQMQKWR